MANGAHIGYQCGECRSVLHETSSELRNGAKAQVRRDFDKCWGTYQAKVRALTKGKPKRYKVS
jgi:hypothetical protein